MYTYHKDIGGPKGERTPSPLDRHLDNYTHACAYVMPRRVLESPWPHRKFWMGFVLFNKQDLHAELVCHEAVHIALEYLRRIRCSVKLGRQCNDNEEFLAYTIGIVTTQLAKQMNDHKLW